MTSLAMILAGWLITGILMALLWNIQRIRTDAGVVDVGWAAGLGLLAVFYCSVANGLAARRLLTGLLAGSWSLRLAFYILLNRVLGKAEDSRYQSLRRTWGKNAQPYFFLFFQAQAIFDLILSISFLIAARNQRPLGFLDFLGGAIWLVAVAGESLADRQLTRFKANPMSRGKTCRSGLWRYSRHPNYFFEWLHWWCYVPLASGAPYGRLAWLAPVLMLYVILKVTGIPLTEAQALVSRGDDYRAYQRTTSAFIPWFPKEES